MSKNKEESLSKFDETVLVRINPSKSNLLVDTAAEWTKGFCLTNQLIFELAKERYQEKYVDPVGEEHERTVLHPQLIPLMNLRHKQIEQIYKISGGEAVNEAKKESAKNWAKMIFEGQVDRKTKQKYEKQAKEIIELEVNGNDEFEFGDS